MKFLFVLLALIGCCSALQIPFSRLLGDAWASDKDDGDAFGSRISAASEIEAETETETARPNIVFILADDQDLQMDSLKYTPFTRELLMKKGTFYKNHFVTTALCCPSRVSLWTGRHAHNTNVTDVNPPYGGYPKFVSQGFNDRIGHLFLWLQQSGYATYYTGKLFNSHAVDNYDSPFVSGFNGSDFLLDPYTYNYLNSTFQRNHDRPVSYEGYHSTDVLASKAYGFLDEAIKGAVGSHNHREHQERHPFFLVVGSPAPHSNIESNGFINLDEDFRLTAPIPPKRFRHLFPDAKVPRTPHFNPDMPSGVNWIRDLPQQNESVVAYNDHFYRNRLRVLQTVDELVAGVVQRLDGAGLLGNTYIIYSSDNGYHIGQHRMQPGKECGFEEDIRVPLFIRGPGVPENQIVDAVTTHIDLAPTIFKIAGLAPRPDFDGVPVPLAVPRRHHELELQSSSSDEGDVTSLHIPDHPPHRRHEHVNVEYWGYALEESEIGVADNGGTPVYHQNNTYKALRIIGPDYNLYYSVWCNNVHQLYDLTRDPYEMENLFENPYFNSKYLLGKPVATVIRRLDALLLVTKSCKGRDCVDPWRVLHPHGDVHTLKDALKVEFDEFYEAQARVSYSRCEFGYLIDAEGPQVANTYTTRRGLGWSAWV